jgi:ABC-type lipoprotein export system ATPase subunit
MKLVIENIIPEPLTNRLQDNASEIWNCKRAFNSGEILFLKAASGKGKSTLIHTLYGLRHDFSGSFSWDGLIGSKQSIQQWSDWRRTKLSIVFQDLRLFGDLTVEENIRIKQELTNHESMDKAKEWLSRLGLSSKWQQRADTLSYGERQRVAIVRSLMQPFTWILLDEPFSHLDDQNAQLAASLILENVIKNKAGVIMVDLEDNKWFPYSATLLL